MILPLERRERPPFVFRFHSWAAPSETPHRAYYKYDKEALMNQATSYSYEQVSEPFQKFLKSMEELIHSWSIPWPIFSKYINQTKLKKPLQFNKEQEVENFLAEIETRQLIVPWSISYSNLNKRKEQTGIFFDMHRLRAIAAIRAATKDNGWDGVLERIHTEPYLPEAIKAVIAPIPPEALAH